MKNKLRVLCLLMAVICLLGACGANAGETSTTTTAATTTKPTTPTEPEDDTTLLDPYRPLPTLPEKFVTTAPATGDLVLAQDGVANATIVIPEGNNKATTAATDLSAYLTKMTGATFAVVTDNQELPTGNLILVGYTKKTQELGFEALTGYPEAEKLAVVRKENCLILYGNDDVSYKGTQNAVTYFLEEAGCGWFSQEELWQVVPDCPTLAVKDVNKVVTPAISSRDISNVGTALYTRWYLGGDENLIGQRLWLYVSKSAYAQHPEWYALVDGVRDPYAVEWWQYCYSNVEFAQAVAQKAIEYFDKHPNCRSFTVAANDGWGEGWCECDACAALGNHADQVLTFANRIADIVYESYPDRRISMLAYHDTFLPPVNGTKAHENVEVMFCVETSPIDDLMADRQIHEGYNEINKIVYSQSWLSNVKQWISVTELQNVSIWGWYCMDSMIYGWTNIPWIQGNVASRNVDVFQSLGVKTVFYDGSYQDNALSMRWPLNYTFAKCMYFGDLTGEEVLYDACQKLYGAAADEMFLFYRIMADSAQLCTSSSGINWVPPGVLDVYYEHYLELRDAAQAVSAKLDLLTPEQRERVEAQLLGWIFIDMVI